MSPQLDLLLDKCLFLDPRFKHNYKTEDECVQQIVAEMTTNSSQSDATRAESTEASPAPPSKKGKFSKLFGTSFLNVRQSTMTDDIRAEHEVNLYLDYPSLCIDESPLRWWKIETAHLPLLSTVAGKYLSVCATIVFLLKGYSVLEAIFLQANAVC